MLQANIDRYLLCLLEKQYYLSEQQCLEGRLYWVLWWELY